MPIATSVLPIVIATIKNVHETTQRDTEKEKHTFANVRSGMMTASSGMEV